MKRTRAQEQVGATEYADKLPDSATPSTMSQYPKQVGADDSDDSADRSGPPD